MSVSVTVLARAGRAVALLTASASQVRSEGLRRDPRWGGGTWLAGVGRAGDGAGGAEVRGAAAAGGRPQV